VEWETNCCSALVAEFEHSGASESWKHMLEIVSFSYESLKHRVRLLTIGVRYQRYPLLVIGFLERNESAFWKIVSSLAREG
jgi:hypothetical protein